MINNVFDPEHPEKQTFSVGEFKMEQDKYGKDSFCIIGGYGAPRAVIVDCHSLYAVCGTYFPFFLEYLS